MIQSLKKFAELKICPGSLTVAEIFFRIWNRIEIGTSALTQIVLQWEDVFMLVMATKLVSWTA